MVDDVRIDAGAAAYRGFLFADMRGFTAFAERHGNVAAAAAVGRFLEIARAAIARHEGAEVKTEGDAIHAVFPSASGAVLCGLEIQDGAAELNAQQPDRPLGLGVGVHAGEAIETAEGYIGRAVNIAARLCNVAQPGEVLVSSTVKGIAQASIPVGFIPRGKRRLKGIADPIVVYAVTRDPTARAPRPMPGPVLLGAGVAAISALITLAAVAGAQLLTGPGSSTGPTIAPDVQPLVIGPLPIGRYRTQAFEPPMTFLVDDPGWTANRDVPGMLGLIRDAAPRGSVHVLRVGEVVENPCIAEADGAGTGLSSGDVIEDLEVLLHLAVSEPVAARIGGHDGKQVDVTVADGALAACGGLIGGGAAIFAAGDEIWSATPGERFRVIVVDVGDAPVTVVMSTDWTETPSVQELEELLELGQRILDSATF